MNKTTVILFSIAFLLSFTQCNTPAPEKLCSDADSRAKTISALMNNDAYMNQVMDSMRTKHPDAILSSIFFIAKSDKQVQDRMMDKMTEMCKGDTAMTKMMVGKTMNMLDDSKLDCCTTGKMMMGEEMAMNHGDQSDCCKKGNMMTGKSGEMTAADKLTCCMMGQKKSAIKVK